MIIQNCTNHIFMQYIYTYIDHIVVRGWGRDSYNSLRVGVDLNRFRTLDLNNEIYT